MQSRLDCRYLLEKVNTSAFARKNDLVRFRFRNEREFLNIASQRLEILGLCGLAQIIKHRNGSSQYGPRISEHAKFFMVAFGQINLFLGSKEAVDKAIDFLPADQCEMRKTLSRLRHIKA